MFGGIAFMVRGHMSCGIVGDALMVRAAPAEADRFLREPHVRVMDFTGRPMRGFVYVDAPGIRSAAALRKWVRRATEHAESLPPKAARRKPVPRVRPRR